MVIAGRRTHGVGPGGPADVALADRDVLSARTGRLPTADLHLVLAGIDLVLGRE